MNSNLEYSWGISKRLANCSLDAKNINHEKRSLDSLPAHGALYSMGPRKPRNYTLELTAEGERRLKIINDFLETYYSITGGNKQGLDCPHITFEVDSKDNRKDYMYFGEYEGLVLSNRPVRTENALLVQGKSDKIASIEIDTITEEEDSPA